MVLPEHPCSKQRNRSDDHAVFSLRSGEKTRVHFPYEFEFQISYKLDEARLIVTYRVVNQDDKTVFFSVGAHPAFAVPFNKGEAYEDYYLEFEQDESLETHLLSAAGYFTGETRSVPTKGRHLGLTKHLFDDDALVFKNLASRRVAICTDRHNHAVILDYRCFPLSGFMGKTWRPIRLY